jgi:hypothetical protein
VSLILRQLARFEFGKKGGLMKKEQRNIAIRLFAVLYRQYPNEHFVIMGLSAVAWSVGNIIWLENLPLFHTVPWWAGFLVLMIAGERLELS